MAKYNKFDSSSSSDPSEDITGYGGDGNWISVVCDGRIGITNFKDDEIVKSNIVTVNQIPTFDGGAGGGGLLSHLYFGLFAILTVSFGLISKSFFEEIGKELARALIKKFKGLDSAGKITVSSKEYYITILVPSHMTTEDCEMLCEKLDSFIRSFVSSKYYTSVNLTFDKDTKKLVVID